MKKPYLIKTSILLLLPSVLLMSIFFIVPVLLTLGFAFTDIRLTGGNTTSFVGFKNFFNAMTSDRFFVSIKNTIVFLVGSAVIGQQLVGFLIAYLMREKNVLFRRYVGLTVLAGWVCPEVVAAFAWLAFLGDSGTLNKILAFFGNTSPVSWLFTFPMISVIVANVWRGTAFSMLVFQSALDNIPKAVEESALIDGARPLQILFKIVIPIIRQSILTNVILISLQTLGTFGMIYALTGGGPGVKTQILPIFIYNQAFVGYQIGYGAAISLFLLILGAIASFVYVRLLNKE